MRFITLLHCLPICGTLVSCATTSVEEEFAEFEPIVRSRKESQEDKAMRMFGDYNPNKTSGFQGKEFKFGGKDAGVRKSIEKKEYADGKHPYFKLREKGYFSDKKAYRTKTAREGSMVASWQQEENSWFKRLFAKKESRLGSAEVTKKDFRLPNTPTSFEERSFYEGKDYPVELINDPQREKRISRRNLGSLLNLR